MELIATAQNNLLPAGSYFGRVVHIIDLGTQTSQFGSQRQVIIRFELPTETAVFDQNIGEQPRSISKYVSLKLTSANSKNKSTLTQIIEACGMTAKSDFNVFDLMGKACMLNIVVNDEYNNIEGFAAVPKQIKEEEYPQINPSKTLVLSPEDFDFDVFLSLQEKTQDKIKQSPEYKALNLS